MEIEEMRLNFKLFENGSVLADFVNNNHIKRDNIELIEVKPSGWHFIYYWQ